ncbi:DUF4405 domain-containing protein [Hydrogenophaga sp. D2P1]|uniref:DUF4405 domain-containing protein n=1 Tax=Hydrogenophaga aromaticivorans TaxID=2610898 RepID=A0A7Y8GVP3_9BURK|nr:DUF4405 domain-containing protein [Hydrogenophaga aromaticivorans]NWF45263.1 DUF4405 domain-containing protein [Hydrogenophaga aromaticivorans]
MNLAKQRPWITPLVMGSFALSAATGVLMFFHLDTGLNKAAHEWLGWLMLGAVVLHALLNLPAVKRHLQNRTGRWVVIGSLVVLGLSFIPVGGSGGGSEPGFAPPVRALAKAPITVLAQVAGTSTDDVKARLQAAGFTVTSDQQSVADLVGGDLKVQIRAMSQVLSPPKS